ncbi:MAG: DNA repair protein RecN [Lachnospiraceae bacterium]|jgi:DNA repair protein RecN (Recombination protein N)|nr:DNA repair protein RecN [Lachnospiraceae bacterium]MCI9017589.1 DNA repair protein RecN [Lachnospiraceae bacterium]MCI9680656.1 DNA repair protein RecN [Lachnospiraceae bacterium]
MLTYLHVKNLALIEEAEIDFSEGLNILTGETGAGKSIVIGSVSLALGGKLSRDMLREGADYGLVELVFQVVRESQRKRLLDLGVIPEEDQVIISRKILDKRSMNKINGETVSLSQLKEAASVLIDIHGQHEHQSLLQKKKHLEILDEFSKEELGPVKEALFEAYRRFQDLTKKQKEAELDEESRLREISLLEFQLNEIEQAGIEPGEDEELEQQYRRMTHGKKILEAAGAAYSMTGYEEPQAAGGVIGHALRELQSVAAYDEELSPLLEQLTDVDALLNDFNRDMAEYLTSLEFSEETFFQTEERLNTLNQLKAKYGRTLEQVLAWQEKSRERLEHLLDYDGYLQKLREDLAAAEEELSRLCDRASKIRKKGAKKLCGEIRDHLVDLNFLDVKFELHFETLEGYTSLGKDDVEFLISVNPGEPLRPLMKIASGGELSRIMLAIKTVLADKDDIDAVIFDEIDVGISGRTAQRVSEKMMLIGKTRQVICITHLAQIAAMADSHYRIEKMVNNGETRTRIRKLKQTEEIEELARILGGAEITDAVMKNAEEMKHLADAKKSEKK